MTPFEVGKAWGGNRKGDQAEAKVSFSNMQAQSNLLINVLKLLLRCMSFWNTNVVRMTMKEECE